MESQNNQETTKIVVIAFNSANRANYLRYAALSLIAAGFTLFVGLHAVASRPYRTHAHAPRTAVNFRY